MRLPRRGQVASVVFIASLAVAGTAAGFLEDALPEGAPETFRTVESRPGDAMAYAVRLVLAQEGSTGAVLDLHATYRFERLEDAWLPLDGGLARTARFATDWDTASFTWDWSGWEDWAEGPGRGPWDGAGQDGGHGTPQGPSYGWTGPTQVQAPPWQATHHMDGRTVATTLRADDGRVPAAATAAVPADADATVTWPAQLPGPCGFRHGMQGTDLDLRRALEVSGQCPPPFSVQDVAAESVDGTLRLRVSGEDEVDGRRTLVFGLPDDPAPLRVWFSEDLAYPVRILTQVFPGGAFGPWSYAGAYVLYDLVESRRGPPADDAEPPQEVPAWDGPRTFLGPAGAGDAPWPLSAAFAAARDGEDDRLRRFLAGHPDAQVVEADGADRWRFVVADGEAALEVRAERRTEETSPVPGLPGTPMTGPREVVDVMFSDTAGPHPAPAALPARAPSEETLRARLTAMTGDAGPVGRSFVFACGDPCPSASATYEVGGAAPDGGPTRSLRLALDGGGSLLHLAEAPTRYDVAEAEPAPGPGFGWGQDAPWDWQVAGAGIWHFPQPKTVAGIGLGATILAAVAFLLAGAKGTAWGLFSRIRPDELLEHPVRQQVVDLVRAEPGIHFQEIVRRLGTGRGTMDHHLRKLVEGGHLAERAGRGFTCYFPARGVDRRVAAAAPILKSQGARQVLGAVLARPGAATLEISRELGLTPSTVNYHVKRLSEAGLLDRARDGRFVRLRATETADSALQAFGAA